MIGIVDYGMGNLRSVQKAFEAVGVSAKIVTESSEVLHCSKVVLPGVGAFGDAVANLRRQNLVGPLLEVAHKPVPMLGICLGLQLFFEESEELGRHKGLGLLRGRVRKFPKGLRAPHIGWNQIHIQHESPILGGVPDGSFFYFVHSYFADAADRDDVLSTTDYGVDFASVVGKDKLFGIQFHPEKSQKHGLRILSNFAEL